MGDQHVTIHASDEPAADDVTEPPICSSKEPQLNQNDKLSGSATSSAAGAEGAIQRAYARSVACLVAHLDTNLELGLTTEEAARRLDQYGLNEFREAKQLSPWRLLVKQVSNSLTLVLAAAMALSFGIHDYIEGSVIAFIIGVNILVGFVQDYKAEKQILSLASLTPEETIAIRDSRAQVVPVRELVPGDVVELSEGDMVPADMRLVHVRGLSTDEAALTGESDPVVKNPEVSIEDIDIPVGDRTNMVFAGSTIKKGKATGFVVATGMDTEMGKVTALVRGQGTSIEEARAVKRAWNRFANGVKKLLGLTETPLKTTLGKFALLLFALAVLLAIIVFSVNLWVLDSETLIYGICVAVAVIPESLIAVLTISLAVGSKEMAKRNVIVRELASLEAVGGATNICSDKTGTLTQGKMIANSAWVPDAGALTVHDSSHPLDPTSGNVQLDGKPCELPNLPSGLARLLEAIALCNSSTVTCLDAETLSKAKQPIDKWTATGEPTEIALQVLAMRFGLGKPSLLAGKEKRALAEFPFDSDLKRMTVIYTSLHKSGLSVFTKGAVESVRGLLVETEDFIYDVEAKALEMASEGFRVLCIAHKTVDVDDRAPLKDRVAAETDLKFVGLVGIYDPPRKETADAVKQCQAAGITVHMLTGDHIETAKNIAKRVGILPPHLSPEAYGNKAMLAADFEMLTDAEIQAMETLPLVLARCSPSSKVRMLEILADRKSFCVMTGDGVNDSPALNMAPVGIAMGLNGSDAARQAANMVLADDNFASIVSAVEEGRRLFDNIQKFLMHLLISNISQVILLLVGLAFKDRNNNSVFPLSPIEILWVNLVTSSPLAIGLGLEEAQPDIMLRPPMDLETGVFTKELIVDKMIYGTFIGCLCLATFVSRAYRYGDGELGRFCNQSFYDSSCNNVFRARATTFTTLTFLLLVTALEVKHFSRSLFNMNPVLYSGPTSVFRTVYRNKFLFWSVIAGVLMLFPLLYAPWFDRAVFKHEGITWEWGIVMACLVVYVSLVESWKAIKRRFGIGSGKVKTGAESIEMGQR